MEPTSPSDDFRLSIDWGDDEGADGGDAFVAAAVSQTPARPKMPKRRERRPDAKERSDQSRRSPDAERRSGATTPEAPDGSEAPGPGAPGAAAAGRPGPTGDVETWEDAPEASTPVPPAAVSTSDAIGWGDDDLAQLAADDPGPSATRVAERSTVDTGADPRAGATGATGGATPPPAAVAEDLTWPPPPPVVAPPVPVPAVDGPTLDALVAQVGTMGARVEALHGEATKLRATTDRRLTDVGSQVTILTDLVADLQLAIATIGDAGSRIERLERSIGDLTQRIEDQIDEHFDLVAARQADAGEQLVELAERITTAQQELDGRVADVLAGAATSMREQVIAVTAQVTDVGDKVAASAAELDRRVGEVEGRVRAALDAEFELLVSRIRNAVDQAELGLRDTYDAGRRETALAREESQTLLADIANELRLVKRRLALRAKPPVAQLSDEQVDGLVRTVAAAVTATITTAAGLPSGPAALPTGGDAPARTPARRPIAARSTPVVDVEVEVGDQAADDPVEAPAPRRRKRGT